MVALREKGEKVLHAQSFCWTGGLWPYGEKMRVVFFFNVEAERE
jgi:hypothetical protein